MYLMVKSLLCGTCSLVSINERHKETACVVPTPTVPICCMLSTQTSVSPIFRALFSCLLLLRPWSTRLGSAQASVYNSSLGHPSFYIKWKTKRSVSHNSVHWEDFSSQVSFGDAPDWGCNVADVYGGQLYWVQVRPIWPIYCGQFLFLFPEFPNPDPDNHSSHLGFQKELSSLCLGLPETSQSFHIPIKLLSPCVRPSSH